MAKAAEIDALAHAGLPKTPEGELKSSKAFALEDWAAVKTFVQTNLKVRGLFSRVCVLIGCSKTRLSVRINSDTITAVGPGRPPALGNELEKSVCGWLRAQCVVRNCTPIRWLQARMQMLAVHLGKSPDLFSSRKLVRAMLRRNGLAVKKAEISSIMRLNSATPELHAAFFDNLVAVGAHELPADMIISIDEAAVVSKEGGKTELVSPPLLPPTFSSVSHILPSPFPPVSQAVGVRGIKAATLGGGGGGSVHVSFAPAVTCAGTEAMPPLIIISGQRMMVKYAEAWKDAFIAMSPSGGMEREVWSGYCALLARKLKKGTVIVIDSHSTRFCDWRSLLMLHEAGIHLVTMPSNATHIYQLLDKAYFRPWRLRFDTERVLEHWSSMSATGPKVLACARAAYDSMFSGPGKTNPGLINGAKSIGYAPFNKDAVNKDVFKPAAASAAAVEAAREKGSAVKLSRADAEAAKDLIFGPLLPPSVVKELAKLPRPDIKLKDGTKKRWRVPTIVTGAETVERLAFDEAAAKAADDEAAAAKAAKAAARAEAAAAAAAAAPLRAAERAARAAAAAQKKEDKAARKAAAELRKAKSFADAAAAADAARAAAASASASSSAAAEASRPSQAGAKRPRAAAVSAVDGARHPAKRVRGPI